MPRSGKAPYRLSEPDLVYSNRQITKLINCIMRRGKKTVAQRHVYTAFDLIKERTKKNPLETFDQAIKNITPQMEVRSRRVGGAAYQVPIPVKGHRGFSLATRWLIQAARKRPNKQYHTFAEKLAAELLDASRGEGGAIQRKLMSHRQAEANKAFAHFRW